jgi:hypothetical protein
MKVLKIELRFYYDRTYGNPYSAGQLIDIEADKTIYYKPMDYGRPDNLESELLKRYIKDNNLGVTHGTELKSLGIYVDRQENTIGYREMLIYSKSLGNEGLEL